MMLSVDFTGSEIYLRNVSEGKLAFEQCQSSVTPTVNFHWQSATGTMKLEISIVWLLFTLLSVSKFI